MTFSTGKGTNKQQINIFEQIHAIGRDKCQGFLGLHNFSGADWGEKIVGISKKTWVLMMMMMMMMILPLSVQYSSVQLGTVVYSTVQYSSVQSSTVQ